MNPHRGMHACWFSSGSTASSTAPPTFSKYTSMPSGQAPPRRVRKCRHLSAPPLNQPLSPPDRKRASCVGLCFPLLAEREFTQPVGASPFGRRLRRRVHPLCGDGGLATGGGGLQAASRLAPPAARVVEPWGSNQPLTWPDTQKGPLAGAFAFLAERWGVTGLVEALPLGQRLGRSVHLLRGDGRRATGGGGLRAAARLAPTAARVVEPVGALIKSPPVPRYAKRPPCGGPFAYLAERGGFEPPKRGLDAYTLSRRAPSTTRTPLRNLPGRRDG